MNIAKASKCNSCKYSTGTGGIKTLLELEQVKCTVRDCKFEVRGKVLASVPRREEIKVEVKTRVECTCGTKICCGQYVCSRCGKSLI